MSFRNRTGLERSPIDAQQMLDVPEQIRPPTAAMADGATSLELREDYLREGGVVGSVPVPANLKGMGKAGVQALMGHRMQALMDKLGERLAFERAGTRLYDAAIRKCGQGDVSTTDGDDPLLPGLESIRLDEARHAELVRQAIIQLGGDPTAQTPAADVVGVEGMGLQQVINEPRTTLSQALHALLTAELVDNTGWALLVRMLEEVGQSEIAGRFSEAERHEAGHLLRVQRWHDTAVMQETRLTGVFADTLSKA